MQFYDSPESEALALRRAAARAGCRVRTLERKPARLLVVDGISRVDESRGDQQIVGRVVCGDGWSAARLLLALALEDADTEGARRVARELRQRAPDDRAYAHAVHDFVSAIPFVREKGEIFQTGGYTIGRNAGDCDDHFRLAYALAVAGGLRAALGVLHHGTSGVPRDKQGPAHAVAVFWIDGAWRFAETTVSAELGESPNVAARRLGMTHERSDIAKEIRIMTEQDLRPIPSGFLSRNPAAQVSLDAQALRLLGYLSPDVFAEGMTDPTSIPLRRAVVTFQSATGLVPDGLLGPTTRLQLAHAIEAMGPPTYGSEVGGFVYPGIEGIDTANAPAIKRSGHLSTGFFQDLKAMASRFQARGAMATAEDFALCFLAESGLNSHTPNHQGYPFGGLNQMGPDERRAAGFRGTFGDYLSLSAQAQLPFVERYFRNTTGGRLERLRDASSVYLANFAPALMAHAADPSFPIFKAAAGSPSPTAPAAEWETWRKAHLSDPYAANRQLDRAKKGFIAVGDLQGALDNAVAQNRPYWDEVSARLDAATGASSPAAGVASVLLVLATMGAATLAVMRS